MVVETALPAAVTEHLSRYMDVLRTRGSSAGSLQEGIQVIDFDLEQPHRHDFYQLLWFERGVGRYQIDFVERPLTDHSLHLVTPGHVHWYKLDPACEGLVSVFLTRPTLAAFSNNRAASPSPSLSARKRWNWPTNQPTISRATSISTPQHKRS